MKKTIHIILAIAALVSCVKTGGVYPSETEIRFEPMTVLPTKANHFGAVADAEYPVKENFDVYGYWSDDWDSDKVINYLISPEEDSGVEFEHKVNYWVGKKPYYWPKYGSLKFACYSPSSLNIEHDYATDTFKKIGYEQPALTSKTWDLLLAPTTGAHTALSAGDHVTIAFEHALSWITLQVKAKAEHVANAFEIKKITIHDVYTKADLNANMSDGVQVEEWSNRSKPVDYVIFEGSQLVTMEATPIETTTAGMVIIPQATTRVTIDYTQREIENSTAELTGQKVQLDLVLSANYKNWEPGKHYVYTLTFNLEEIKIKPTVKPWTPVENTLNKND